MKKCPYCENDTNGYVLLNQDVEYTGIEMTLNRQGMLRVRTYMDYPIYDSQGREITKCLYDSQDTINIKYCPMCGRKFVF